MIDIPFKKNFFKKKIKKILILEKIKFYFNAT